MTRPHHRRLYDELRTLYSEAKEKHRAPFSQNAIKHAVNTELRRLGKAPSFDGRRISSWITADFENADVPQDEPRNSGWTTPKASPSPATSTTPRTG